MLSPQTPPTANASWRNREQDTCFFCKLKGHWASHCPSKSPPPPAHTHQQQQQQQHRNIFLEINGRRYQRCLVCPNCGLPCCSLLSSSPAPAPAAGGRPYFRCSSKSGKKCFFKWGDEVKSEQLVNVPICSCGAAPCCLTTPTTGPFAGFPLFICPIQKGQGACSFSQPLNAEVITANTLAVEELNSRRSTLTSCDDSNPSSLLDEGDYLENEATDTNTPKCHEDGAVSLHVKRGNEMLMLIEEHEGASNERQKHSKRLRHGAPENDSSLVDSATGCVDEQHPELQELSLEELTLIVQLENNFRHVESPKEMSIVDIPPQAFYSCSHVLSTKSTPKLLTAAKQKLGVQLHDWLGRLAFSPSRSLINPAPKPYFCCIFPSFDPIYASEHVNRVCVEKASGVVSESPLFPDQDDPSNLVLWKPCPQSDPDVVHGNFMTTTILEGFAQLAIRLQNELLSRLYSMDFHDHESMTPAATSTFDALKQLKMDYGPLRAKVNDFINCALSLVQIEGSIIREQSSHELVAENCCREKIQLDGISRAYAKAEADVEASRKRLQSLGVEASRLRDVLFHVEAELICCEAENQNLKAQYIHWSEKKLASERRVEVACTEAEEAAKVCQMREEEKDVAEEAFKKAKRMLLRK